MIRACCTCPFEAWSATDSPSMTVARVSVTWVLTAKHSVSPRAQEQSGSRFQRRSVPGRNGTVRLLYPKCLCFKASVVSCRSLCAMTSAAAGAANTSGPHSSGFCSSGHCRHSSSWDHSKAADSEGISTRCRWPARGGVRWPRSQGRPARDWSLSH